MLPIFIALLVYSVTWSFIWDEGFHLIAAQLIAEGKRPYIDFCFPQTPLNAYINAALLLIFGHGWRPIHVVAALYLCVAIWLVAGFIYSRLPDEKWRMPCALSAAALLGLNSVVVQFGPAAQAYPIGLLGVTAAFRAALAAVSSKRIWFAALAGFAASAAAASTLLTAPVLPVLLIWLWISNAAGSKIAKISAYLAASAVPFFPVFWLYAQGPKQTLFNVLQYQALYRRTNWGNANLHDLDALTDWINSPEALILLVLFAAALIFLVREKIAARREFALAGALAVALVLFISTAHPTFERYYVVGVPFIVIVAALGLYAAGSRLAGRHARMTAAVLIVFCWCGFFRGLFDERDDDHWSDYEDVSRQVAEVAPLNAYLLADELVFFVLQRDPPEGLEFSYAEKLDLPPDQEKLMHVVSLKELKQKMQAGQIDVLQTCRESLMDDFQPAKFYKRHTEPADCDLFWQPAPSLTKR